MWSPSNFKKRDIISTAAARLLGTSDLVEEWTDCVEGDKFFDTDASSGGGTATYGVSTIEADTTVAASAVAEKYTTDNKASPIVYGTANKWVISTSMKLTYTGFVAGCRASVQMAINAALWRFGAWHTKSPGFFVFSTDGGDIVTTKALDQVAHEWIIHRNGTTTVVYCDGASVGSGNIFPSAATTVKGLSVTCTKSAAGEQVKCAVDWVYVGAPRAAL